MSVTMMILLINDQLSIPPVTRDRRQETGDTFNSSQPTLLDRETERETERESYICTYKQQAPYSPPH